MGLERGPPSLVNTIEELLKKKISRSGCGDLSRLAVTWPTDSRSVSIVRSRISHGVGIVIFKPNIGVGSL
jgi:hypothetical protein